MWRHVRCFAYLLPGLHFVLLVAVCLTDVQGIVEKIGMIDFPLTLLASPILMNVPISGVWVVIYYLIAGSLLWYFAGKGLDRWFATD
jgi:hypothetical protein